jgi:hypothetical protein
MIGKGLWFAAGAAAGVYGTVKAKRVAEAFTVEGIKHRAKGAALGARMLREEVAQGKAEAEVELRERFELASAEKYHAIHAADAGLDTPSLVPREGYSTSQQDKENELEENDH